MRLSDGGLVGHKIERSGPQNAHKIAILLGTAQPTDGNITAW